MKATTLKNLSSAIFFVVAFFLISNNAYSGVSALAFKRAIKTSPTTARVQTRFAANDPKYGTGLPAAANNSIYTTAVDIGAASLAAVFKKRAFSPWGIAIATAITAAGYLIDEQGNQITSNQQAEYTGQGHCRSANHFLFGIMTATECLDITNGQSYQEPIYRIISAGSGWQYLHQQGGSYFFVPSPDTTTSPGTIEPTIEPLTDPEIVEIVFPQIQEAALPDILTDPQTGLPDEAITELTQIENNIQTEINNLNDADPANDPVEITPNVSITEQHLIEEVQQQQEEEANSDFNFSNPPYEFDTTLEIPEKTDFDDAIEPYLQQIDELTNDIGITATSGSCSISIPVSVGSYSKNASMDFCQYESIIESIGVILVAISYLYAAFILLGVKH